MDDITIIERHGGPAKLASKLGFVKNGAQRVYNWRERGIPARVKLDRQDLFGPDAIRQLDQPPAAVKPTAKA